MKTLPLILAAAALLTTPAMAQQTASLWWGYGDGQSISKGVGGGSSASTQTAAVQMPADAIASYAGSRIKAIRFAVAGNDGYCNDVSYFLSTNVKAVADAERTQVGRLTKGWHEYQLTEPYTITTGQDLYIGYTATGVRPIAIVSEPGGPGTCWMTTGKTYYDYGTMDGYNYTLGVQVLIESDNFEAGLTFVDMGNIKTEPTEGELSVTVRSMSPVPISSYEVSLAIDDAPCGTFKGNCSLEEIGQEHGIILPLPELSLGTHTYTVSLTAINGEAPKVEQTATGNIEVLEMVMFRTHVIEECTGTWCGYCTRGIVAMSEMHRNHPDRFIGIAVHGRDEYATSSYNPLLDRISGYPAAFFNRKSIVGTFPADMEVAFQKQPEMSEGEVRFVGIEYTDATKKQVKIAVRYRFAEDHNTADYRLAFVTLEDDLYALQANSYSGSSTPMGGFESLGKYAAVYLQDVARDITSYYGIQNSVPAEIKAGQWYNYEYTYTLPSSVSKRNNMSIVCLLQTYQGNEILNAAKCHTISMPGESAIPSVAIDQAQRQGDTQTYDLQGRPAATPARGLSIQQGRVVFQR